MQDPAPRSEQGRGLRYVGTKAAQSRPGHLAPTPGEKSTYPDTLPRGTRQTSGPENTRPRKPASAYADRGIRLTDGAVWLAVGTGPVIPERTDSTCDCGEGGGGGGRYRDNGSTESVTGTKGQSDTGKNKFAVQPGRL